MNWIWLMIIAVSFILLTESESRENNDYLDYLRKHFWSKYRNSKKYPGRYSKLTFSRHSFYYWDDVYHKWSNWTKCSPESCTKSRYRECKDKSWNEHVINFKVQKKCPVQFIYEKKVCNDTEPCSQKNTLKKENSSSIILPENCGTKPLQIENKIYGGAEASKNSWPWHVGLYIANRFKPIYICGGTLINSGWIVTAAHCLKTVDKVNLVQQGELIDTRKYEFFDSFLLKIGNHDRSKKGDYEIKRKISHFIIHRSFRTDYTSNYYDVALLKLDENVPEKMIMNFPCVPKMKNYTLTQSDTCYAIGWGDVRSQDPYHIWSFEFDWFLDKWKRNIKPSRSSFVLQEAEIPLVDFEKCKRTYRLFNLNKSIHVCAGSLAKDTCRGDSGGGLFCLDPNSSKWQLYGITNFGSSRGCGKGYGVYIRVAEVADWIRKIIKKSIDI